MIPVHGGIVGRFRNVALGRRLLREIWSAADLESFVGGSGEKEEFKLITFYWE